MSTCSNTSRGSLGKVRSNRIGYAFHEQQPDDDIDFSEVTEKIILNINTVFEKDDALDEFDIIVEESQSNHSPVFHVDHKLAIESWCVPFLYQHSVQHFNSTIVIPQNEKIKARRNLPSPTSHTFSNGHASPMAMAGPSSQSQPQPLVHVGRYYQNSNPTCKSCSRQANSSYTKPSSKPPPQLTELERMKRGHELSRILLLINPDYNTAWNFRRELFLNKRHVYEIGLTLELNLIALVCSRKPKCLEAFNYRRWIIEKHLASNGFDYRNSIIWRNPLEFFRSEIKFIERAAASYFSNYHAWTYRMFLLTAFLNQSPFPATNQKEFILEMELTSANSWLQSHVSDHSGFHYRQKLLLQIHEHHESKMNFNEILKLYMEELKENYRMICYFIGHESLWYHRRAILKQFLTWIQRYESQQQEEQQQQLSQTSNGIWQPAPDSSTNPDIDFNAVTTSIYLDEKSLVEYIKNEVAGLEMPGSTVKSSSSPDYSLININVFDQTKNLKHLNLVYAQRHCKWCQYSFNWAM